MSKNTSVLLTVIGAIVGAALGATATIATGALGYLEKDRELDIRLVDVGLAILSGENKGTTTEPARRFALRLLSKYTNIDIPKSEFDEWVKYGVLPSDLLNKINQRQAIVSELDELQHKLDIAQINYAREISGLSPSGHAGMGPFAMKMRDNIETIRSNMSSLRNDLSNLQQDIDRLNTGIESKK